MMRCLFGRFLPLLVQANLVTRSQKKNPAGYGAYDVYYLTPKGNQQLHALAQQPPPPLLLPVPDSVRKAEVTPGTAWMPCTAPRASFDALSRCRIWQEVDRQAATKTKAEVEALRERLRVAGYDLAAVPESEVRRCHRSARSPPRRAVSVEARAPWWSSTARALTLWPPLERVLSSSSPAPRRRPSPARCCIGRARSTRGGSAAPSNAPRRTRTSSSGCTAGAARRRSGCALLLPIERVASAEACQLIRSRRRRCSVVESCG